MANIKKNTKSNPNYKAWDKKSNNQKKQYPRSFEYKIIEKHSVAPYNFISQENNNIIAYNDFNELPKHNRLYEDKVSGYIEYEIVNHTPLVIGDGKNQAKEIKIFKNHDDKFTIPGNTIRGMVRNNLSVLSLSDISDFVSDQQFYFRSFGQGGVSNVYTKKLDIRQKPISGEKVSAPHNVLAGYIKKINVNEYEIYSAKEVENAKLTYFRISEHFLRNMTSPNVKGINYMYTDKILDLINNKNRYSLTPDEKQRKKALTDKKKYKLSKEEQQELNNLNRLMISKQNEKKDLLKYNRNKEYSPYCIEVGFEVNDRGNVSKIDLVSKCSKKGFLLSSEFIMNKQAHYLIPEIDKESVVKIRRGSKEFADIEYYIDDLLRTKKYKINEKSGELEPKTDKGEYFKLPEVGEREKPFFYAKFKGRVFIGRSPYLRIPYEYSVKSGIKKIDYNQGYDYVQALFGFAEQGKNKKSYKGRLSFEDCVFYKNIDLKRKKYEDFYSIVLNTPSPTNYPSYLEQNEKIDKKKLIDYNNNQFKIRGIKQYWIKDFVSDYNALKEYSKNKSINESILTKFRPIRTGSVFKGKINFNNLTREELGLLAWALKVHEKANENIGLGKSYGFGRVQINNIKIMTEDIKKKYSSINAFFYNEEDREALKNKYIDYIKTKYKINLNRLDSIKELMMIKTYVVPKENANETRYMLLDFENGKYKGNEFTKLKVLPKIEEAIDIMEKNFNTDYFKNFNNGQDEVATEEDFLKLAQLFNRR